MPSMTLETQAQFDLVAASAGSGDARIDSRITGRRARNSWNGRDDGEFYLVRGPSSVGWHVAHQFVKVSVGTMVELEGKLYPLVPKSM